MTTNQTSIFKKFQAKFPNVKAVSDCNTAQHVADDIDAARDKVVKKLLDNKAHVDGGFKTATGGKRPDRVYKRKANGTFGVGVKYGNRWLQDLFGEGQKMLDGLTDAELSEALSVLAECAKNAEFDGAIERIMENNKADKQSRDNE